MRRPRETRPAVAVEWRAGVHIAGTPLWCDALRTREACFVSSALQPEVRRHRQIIATQATLDLLPEPRLRGRSAPRALAVPTGRPFTLGELRLELFPSGAAIGAASLLVDLGAWRTCYAGAVQLRPGRIAGAAEVRACDVLILDATFGRFRFPPAAAVLDDLDAWVERIRLAGETPIVLVPPLANGPDVLRHLKGPIRVHRAIAGVLRRLARLGIELPAASELTGPPAPGEVILWPPSRRQAAAVASLPRARFALVSGWAADAPTVARLRVDAVFPLAEQAGADDLEAYAGQSGARTVYLLGPGAADLGRTLADKGIIARRLGPPEQLKLPTVI